MGIIGLIPLIHLTIKYNTVDIKRITYVIGGFYMLISGLITYMSFNTVCYFLVPTHYYVTVYILYIISYLISLSITTGEILSKESGMRIHLIISVGSSILLFLVLILGIISWSVWGNNAYKYANLVNIPDTNNTVKWEKDQQPIDPTNTRVVTYELALSLARTSLSDSTGSTLGSKYELDEEHITLQKIDSGYFYLIPIDYSGFFRWLNTDFVYNYIKVSATNIKN